MLIFKTTAIHRHHEELDCATGRSLSCVWVPLTGRPWRSLIIIHDVYGRRHKDEVM